MPIMPYAKLNTAIFELPKSKVLDFQEATYCCSNMAYAIPLSMLLVWFGSHRDGKGSTVLLALEFAPHLSLLDESLKQPMWISSPMDKVLYCSVYASWRIEFQYRFW